MIISISGMDNSGKTTQVKKLMQDYPKVFTNKLHISDVSAFDKEKNDFDWWFNKSTPAEFVRTMYSCLKERIELAKKLDNRDEVIILEKGIDFYEARITATLLAKGLNIYEAMLLQYEVRKEFDLEDIEIIKFYLLPGNYKRESDLSYNSMYQTYLINNMYLLEKMNIDYEYIETGEIEDVEQKIYSKVMERRCENYEKVLSYRL